MIPAVMAIGSVMTYKPLSIQPLGLTAGAGGGLGGGGEGRVGVAIGSVIAIGDATGATGRAGSGGRDSTCGSGAGGPGMTGGLGGMPSAGSTGRVGIVAETMPLRSAGSPTGTPPGFGVASVR